MREVWEGLGGSRGEKKVWLGEPTYLGPTCPIRWTRTGGGLDFPPGLELRLGRNLACAGSE